MTSAIRTHYTLPRLYVPEELCANARIELPRSQAHYLIKVMRLKQAAQIRVFNENDGEWLAEISAIQKRDIEITVQEQLRLPSSTPDIWVLFAPVKKSRNDFIVEKATELGALLIRPVLTRRTTMPHVKVDRMRAQAIEAAEQTERMSIPLIKEPFKLEKMVECWNPERALIFADEAGDAQPAIEAFQLIKAPCALLIGPEGGFDQAERELLRAQSFVTPVSLGPRILRADTAVAASLALWQAVSGDWS